MQISRRSALLGASAAVAVAGVPGAVQADDAALLAQVAEFHELYDRSKRSWAKQKRQREAVEDMPDCPELDGTREGNRAHSDFMDAHDAYKHSDECNRLNDLTGALANEIFERTSMMMRLLETGEGAPAVVEPLLDDEHDILGAFEQRVKQGAQRQTAAPAGRRDAPDEKS